MKHAFLIAMLLIAAAVPCPAQQPGPHEAEFRSFYSDFLAAVRANNKERLADMIAFPVEDWSVERNGDVQTETIKDRAEFLAKYPSYFTRFMRLHAPHAKLEALPDGAYTLIWHDANAEFSFEFDYVAGTGYRVRSYDIGPE